MSYPKTFYSGLLPKNSSLDYNPVIVHRKKSDTINGLESQL